MDLLSDGPTDAPWTIAAFDAYQQIGSTPSLTLALDLVSTLGTTTRHWVGGIGISR